MIWYKTYELLSLFIGPPNDSRQVLCFTAVRCLTFHFSQS